MQKTPVKLAQMLPGTTLTAGTLSHDLSSNAPADINARYFYCINFPEICNTEDTYFYLEGTENHTFFTDEMSGGTFLGGSCWWSFSVNQSYWQINVTEFAVYIMENEYIWVYAGVANDRENITEVTILTSPNKYTFPTDEFLFIAAVPTARSVYTSFYMNISIEGEPLWID